MRLHFDRKTIERLVEHAKNASTHARAFGKRTGVPALWLVGDEGVYLMSSGQPRLVVETGSTKNVVAYAREADPAEIPFDTWWAAKNASFGPDDGVEIIDLADVVSALEASDPERDFVLDVTPRAISLVVVRKKLIPASPRVAA